MYTKFVFNGCMITNLESKAFFSNYYYVAVDKSMWISARIDWLANYNQAAYGEFNCNHWGSINDNLIAIIGVHFIINLL